MNLISLQQAQSERSVSVGSAQPTPAPRRYLEFLVDSSSLRAELAAEAREFNLALELVSVLVLDWPIGFPEEDYDRLIDRLPPPLPYDRVPLYICAECGDLGCGAVTVRIEHLDDQVVWREFGYEDGYEPFDLQDVFSNVGPFTFDRPSYLATLQEFRARWPDVTGERHQ